MTNFGKLLFSLLLLLTGIYFFRKHREKKLKEENDKREQKLKEENDKRTKEENRQKTLAFINSNIEQIKEAETYILGILNAKEVYFSNYLLKSWLLKYEPLIVELADQQFDELQDQQIDLSSAIFIVHFYNNNSIMMNEYNDEYIIEELNRCDEFFDNIEGRVLDFQQRRAIITDEDNNLIVAGAGSGKTTTIIGKINYVIDKYKLDPKEILLISFTNKSASTLAERINTPGIDSKTFHKLGLHIIGEVQQLQPDIFEKADFKRIIENNFNELIQNEDYLKKVTLFFTDYLKPYEPLHTFDDLGIHIQHLKDNFIRTFKKEEIKTNGRTTYNREVVKSLEECKIANFLLFNGIEYEYEKPYLHRTVTRFTRQYKPDFTISQNGKTVYLEHFALDKNANVPPFFANKDKGETLFQASNRYKDGIHWKKEIHYHYFTNLIESFSHEMYDGTLFEKLTKNLKEQGIELNPKTPSEIWEIIQSAAKEDIEDITSLFQTFITLMKSNNYSINDLIIKNKAVKNAPNKNRNDLFIELIRPIYEMYQDHLLRMNKIDFSDMINLATECVETNKYTEKYKYIIIDEFQDISIGRYNLIKAIKNNNPECKLLAVGDDWQSIYRFSGSDISLFKDFETYFGVTAISKIETTYRFQEPLLSLSSKFILQNPNQVRKQLQGLSSNPATNYRIVYSENSNNDDTIALKSVFDLLISQNNNIREKEIILLGRYSHDIKRINFRDPSFQINEAQATVVYKYNNEVGEEFILKSRFLTVHRAKGLEADIVIVLNCNSGKYGFPSEISDDKVLNLLLSKSDHFENGEERRLFYVAMTRAKEQLFLIANRTYKSKFITQLENDNSINISNKCPRCHNSELVLKTGVSNGRNFSFYGCSNFLYGCDFTRNVAN